MSTPRMQGARIGTAIGIALDTDPTPARASGCAFALAVRPLIAFAGPRAVLALVSRVEGGL